LVGQAFKAQILLCRGAVTLFTDFFTLNWFFDACLNYTILAGFLSFCREVTFKLLDKGLLETFGPFAITNSFSYYSKRVSTMSSGYIFHYAFLLILGVAYFFILNFFFIDSVNFELIFVQFAFFAIFFLNFRE
jgi:hypothetical protein